MAVSRRYRWRALLGAALLCASVAGCGRRGRLEPAPDPNAPPQSEVTKQGLHRRAKNPPITPPHEPFVLDPLL